MYLFDPSSGGIPEGGNRCSVCPKDGSVPALIPLPRAQHLADVDGVDAGFEAVVPLLRGPVAEVFGRLVPGRHGLALHDHAGLLVVGGAVRGVGQREAHGGGLGVGLAVGAVRELAPAALAEELPHRRVVELHDGEAFVALHELVGVACRSHIHRHRRAFVAQVVADGAPADGHRVALRGVAHAEDEVLGEPRKPVLRELLLYVEGRQIPCFLFHFLFSFFAARAAHHRRASQNEQYPFHTIRNLAAKIQQIVGLKKNFWSV